MSQPGRHQLEHLPLCSIQLRVWSQFWLGFGGPWDIRTRTQAVCLWGQSCEGLGWYHIARLFHRPFPSQRRDQLPAAFVQRHLGDIFRDSQGDQLCYDVSWNHTGFCVVSWIFSETRWSEYWSFVSGPCIGNWLAQWVYNWGGQCGPCLVWGSGSLLLLSTGQENLQRSISCLVSLLGSSLCPHGDASTNCCGSHQAQVHGFWPSWLTASDPTIEKVCCRLQCCLSWSQFPPFSSRSFMVWNVGLYWVAEELLPNNNIEKNVDE